MISYVAPLHYGGSFIGIVGIDFDYTLLTEIVQKIKIYENGFAHLKLNNVIMQNCSENTADTSLHDNSEKIESSRGFE